MHGIQQAERFHGSVVKILLVDLKRHHPPSIYIPKIHRRMSVDYPFGQHLAGAACRLNTDRIESSRQKEVRHLYRGAEPVSVIRGEAFRPVEKDLDSGLTEHRNSVDCTTQLLLDMLDVFRQSPKFEFLWDPFHAPRLGHRLEHPDHHLAGIFLVVVTNRGFPNDRQVSRKIWNGFGDHIKMFCGMQGHRNSCLKAQRSPPHPGAIDHCLASDSAPIGNNRAHPASLFLKGLYGDTLIDSHTFIPRAARQRLRRIGRVGLAIPRQKNCAHEVLGGHDRIKIERFFRANDFDFKPKTTRHGGAPFKLLKPLGVCCEAERSILTKACRLPRQFLKFRVEIGGVLGQPCQVLRGPQLSHQPRCVPGCATGQ